MKVSIKFIPVSEVKRYNGTSEKGSYSIVTWKVKGLDNKEFIVNCFGDTSDRAVKDNHRDDSHVSLSLSHSATLQSERRGYRRQDAYRSLDDEFQQLFL